MAEDTRFETGDVAQRRQRLAARRAALTAAKREELERLLKDGEETAARVIPRRTEEGPSPLSFSQERLWFLDQLEPGSALYNIPVVFRLAGPLERASLAAALAEVVRRHESLRTRFVAVDGRPLQVVVPDASADLPVVDLRDLPVAQREEAAHRLALQEIGRPFDLAAGSLLRVTLLRLGEEEHLLVVTMHHIVSDGWSLQVLIREVGTLYRAFGSREPASLPELPIQYADYASWQRGWLQGDALQSELAYWRRQLAGLPPVLPLPTDRPRPAAMSFEGGMRRGAIPEELTGALRVLAREEEVTLFVALLAAFQALLSRYSGQEDLAVGTPVAGRRWVEVEELIGFFVNTLVIRSPLAGGPATRELLLRVRETVLEAQSHQDLPFEKLVEELRPERSLSHGPLFQVMFVFQNVPKTVLEVERLNLSELDFDPGVEKFDLTLAVAEEEGRLVYSLGYSRDLFDAETVDRMLGHWRRMLEAMVAAPDESLWEAPLLGEEELRQALWEWNDPARSFAGGATIVGLFAAEAAARPAAAALSWEGETVTYQELRERSNRLAHTLQRMGVGPETCVALCLPRSPEMVVALLGILKAGGAYVPLDPAHPRERLAFILEDSRARVLLTQSSFAATLPEYAGRSLFLDREEEAISRESADDPPGEILPDHAAYVLYTSGSTGRPKGVVVGHGNVARLLAATHAEFGFGPDDVWTLFHSYAFDFSVWELWGALLYGGRCVVVPYWVSRSPESFYGLLCAEGVTVLNQTPSAFLELLAVEEARAEPGDLALRHVIFGGEALPVGALAPWMSRHGDQRPRLINMYGITETTVHVTCRPLTAADVRRGAGSVIGGPIPDLQVHLADSRGQLVPVGVAGEVLVGGAGLSRGYLGRPDLTAERFVPDPFGPHPGARLYRSGDLARRRPDGDLEYLGRIDHQVKIRGHRIELGEIEAALRSFPAVRGAVVLDGEDSRGDRRLVAYVVPQGEPAPSVEELRAWLGNLLPDYMLPAAWMLLDEIPLTPNGKVDRRALPDPGTARTAAGEGFVPPRTPVEEVLATIWSEVLGLREIGRTDDFFRLGGHSLLATRVLARVREAFDVELPVRALFEASTLTGLAERIEAGRRQGSGLATPPLRRLPRQDNPPLSYAQQRLWFLDQLAPESSAYSIPAAVELAVELEVAALERCVGEVVRRHEILRTTFVNDSGQPRQVIAEAAPVLLPQIDLGGLPSEVRDAEVGRLAREEALRPFDVSRGPLLRVSLLRLGARRYRMLVTLHHIVSDGWSMDVLTREMEALYDAFANGRLSPLPELPIQYADYAQWQREWLQGDLLAAELDYWRRHLSGAPTVLEIDTDRPRQAARKVPGEHCPIALPPSLSGELRELSRREGATLFMTLMAGFQALLERYTGQDDILVGTPIAGRSRLELESLIGFFVNMVVLRADFRGRPSFCRLLRQVRESALGAYTHQELPFDKLVEELQPARSLGRNPLFQAILAFQEASTPETAMARVTLLSGSPGNAETKFDLELYLWESQAGITGSFVYSPELFERATIRRMADHFEQLLGQIAIAPDAGLADLTLLSAAEIHHLVTEWNDTAAEFPRDACIHQIFEEQAGRTPDAIALEFEQERVTYGELNRRANRLAHALRRQGVGPEVLVGVLLDRSVEMVVALLGIAKAGGVYVPVNVADPARRISFILEDAGISILLTVHEIAERLPPHELTVVRLDHGTGAFAGEPEENPAGLASAENLAYMIYTSGSTGLPKGACITHRNVVKLVRADGYAELDAGQVFLQFAPVSFDASTFEIWGCLLNGGRLVIFPPRVPTLAEMGELLARAGVTTAWLTAGLFHQMVDENLEGLRTVRQLLAGGEALSAHHVDRVLDGLPECRLINGYGPTETTTFACCYRIERDRPGLSVPIGRPIANTRVYLLNEALRPAAIGERAELFIGGEGLARGYLKRPDLTAERFMPDPFGSEPGGRLYRTGDRVRILDRGLIEFLGRVDHQVKIRGFRIELGEVEAVLVEHPAVKEAVILAREDTPGDKRLVAYIVAHGGEAPGSEALKAFLKERLPEYMVPAVCVVLEAFPLTTHGKVDRAALPAPDRALLRSERAFVPPRDALQRQLVEIWESLLGIRPIGIRDDFFELGGHSLLMVQLIARIEERLGQRIPMAALLQGATIDHLSQLMRQEVETPSWSLLVPIQPNGTNPPLFCVHPAGGNVFCYTDLARHLGDDQPFYGIQARESNKDLVPHTRIEAMAAEYVEAIRAFQPVGPYRIGGWSMGGVIAFEMARQLHTQGHEIALLMLMDVEAPSGQPADYTWVVLLGSFALDLGLSFDQLKASWDEISALPPMGQLSRVAVEAKAAGLVPSDLTLAEFRKLFDAFKTNAQIMRSYAGGVYEGRVVLFRAEKPLEYIGKELPANYYANLEANPHQDGVDPRDPTKGWGKWASQGVELYSVPGDHYSMVREPHVKLLAEQMNVCLRSAAKEL